MNLFEPACIWPVDAELAEGPLWDAATSAVYFVDIKGPAVHRCDMQGGQRTSWPAPQPIGFVQPLATGGFIAGLKDGLYRFDERAGENAFERALPVEPHLPGNRLNDAYTDAAGHLWFGSMDDGEQLPTGALYQIDSRGEFKVQDTGYVITNGPAKSPDGRTLYHTDTMAQVVYAFDIAADGQLSNKRALVHIRDGYPDGTAVDAGGSLWIALFAGGRVERYSPRGELLQTVKLPCSNVTKVAFGGPDLCTAFVTTAWKGLSPQERQQQPLAGGLFAFRTDVPGLPQASITQGFLP